MKKTLINIYIITLITVLLVNCAPKPKTTPTAMPTEGLIDWSGKWQVWIGPDLQEAEVELTQKGDEVTVQLTINPSESYTFSVKTSSNGRDLSGTITYGGITGKGQIHMLDNRQQFTGNVMGIAALCGARPGASRPDPCRGP